MTSQGRSRWPEMLAVALPWKGHHGAPAERMRGAVFSMELIFRVGLASGVHRSYTMRFGISNSNALA